MPAFLLPQDPESVGRGEGAPRPRAPRCSLSRDGWTLEGQRRADWLWPEEAPSQLTRYKTKCEEETSTPPIPLSPSPTIPKDQGAILAHFLCPHVRRWRRAPCTILHNLLSHHYIQCNVEALRQFYAF